MKDTKYKENYKVALESNPLIGEWIFGIVQNGRKYDLGIFLTDEKFGLLKKNEIIGDIDLNEKADIVQQKLEDLMAKHPFPS